jgi:hypothetical protein
MGRMITLLVCCLPLAGQTPLVFREHTIATDLKGGYQVVVADLNHDGKPDIIALASGMPDLVWYENPTWERHVLVSNLPHMINCAAEDIDGDGIPEIVIAWEFANSAANSVGRVGVLRHDEDPREPWRLQLIDVLTTSHRLRWADIDGPGKDGSGRKVVLNAPLTGAQSAPPGYIQDHAPLVFYRPGEWKRQTVSQVNLGVQHGILVARWDPKDTRDSILTASFSGIDLYQYAKNAWTRTEIAKGDPSPCPRCGSSDIAIGYAGPEKFLAAIEPWHGNQVVIYTQKAGKWERRPIDDSLVNGHTILTADFDGDGRDEVIAGFRQGDKSVFLYRDGKNGWEKQVIDRGGMGAASCAAADLNGDRAPDIVCIGTPNLKWYENVSRPK